MFAISFPTDQSAALHDAMAQTGSDGWMQDAIALKVWHDDTALAIVVVQSFAGHAAEGHLATYSPRWCHPKALATVFAFLKLRHGVKRLRIPISCTNRAAQIAALKAGFEIEGVMKAGMCNGSDAIIMSRDTTFQHGDASPATLHRKPESGPILED